jgi:hypothetical protein
VIALAAGSSLVGIAAISLAALLHVRGAVAFALAVAVLSFAEVVAVSHALSVFDAYERGWFLVTLALVAFPTAAAVTIVRPAWPSVGRTAVVRDIFRDPVVAVLGALVLAEVGYLLALALFTPPTEYDVLTYHLTRALLWIQQGSVGPIAGVTDTRINDLPPNAELAQGMTVLLSRSLRWAGLVQMAALGVSVLGVYGIASRIDFERRAAAFGALVFATLPVVAMQAPTALNDVVVAALVTTTVFFVLGRSRADLALACVSAAVLVGTKVTALIAAPVIVAIAVLVHRGRRLAALMVAGLAAGVVGGAWYAVNLNQGTGALGTTGELVGAQDGLVRIVARASRYAVETVEAPGAFGRNNDLYLVGAAVIALFVWLLRGRWSTAVVAGSLAALPVLTLRAEHGLHRVYWNGWELVGFDEATRYGTIRDPTIASNLQSWYGPLGVSLCVAASIVVTRRAYRGNLPWVAAILSIAPIPLLLGVAVATGYNPFSGRYVMGGVALSAATWGFVRSMPAVAWAVVAIAATTLVLTLADFAERPAGVGLLETARHASVWTLPRAWTQNIKPELALVTTYVDAHASPGTTIAVTRDQVAYPAVYVGWPAIDHRIVYADTLDEATNGGAAWALLPDTAPCAIGWRLALHSPPWTLWHRDPDVLCRPG